MPVLSFEAFQQLDLPLYEIVAGPSGFIHDALLVFPFEVTDTLPDDDSDLVVLTGNGERIKRVEELAARRGRAIVAFPPHDLPVKPTQMPGGEELPEKIVAAYATNFELTDPRAVALPLGVRTNKLRQLQFVKRNHTGDRSGLLYGSFATENRLRAEFALVGAPHRARLAERLDRVPWATLDVFPNRRDDPELLLRYYSRIASHRFVLAPPGYGADTYRIWESLYLGAIPIVVRCPAMRQFADLPILFTEDYSELSERYLWHCWEEMSQRSYDLEKLLKSHYREHFLRAVATIRAPRFICWQCRGFPPKAFAEPLERTSRVPSEVVTEAPLPPFVGRSPLQAKGWHASTGLDVEEGSDGLRLAGRATGERTAEMALTTIAGGRFRLRGLLRQSEGPGVALTVTVRAGREELGRQELSGADETPFSFDFVARSNRSMLMLEISSDAPEAGLLLSELTIEALV